MSITIVTYLQAGVDTPLESPGALPTIRIRRTDTGALVVTDSDMVETGDGNYSFVFAAVDGLDYSFRIDGDPLGTGQTIVGGQFAVGTFSGTTEAGELRVDELHAERGLAAGAPAVFDSTPALESVKVAAKSITIGVGVVGPVVTLTRA